MFAANRRWDDCTCVLNMRPMRRFGTNVYGGSRNSLGPFVPSYFCTTRPELNWLPLGRRFCVIRHHRPISPNRSVLFRTRPRLDLHFGAKGLLSTLKILMPNQLHWSTARSELAISSCLMFSDASFEIISMASIIAAIPAFYDVDPKRHDQILPFVSSEFETHVRGAMFLDFARDEREFDEVAICLRKVLPSLVRWPCSYPAHWRGVP